MVTAGKVEVFRTAKETGERLSPVPPPALGAAPAAGEPSIFVDLSQRFQVMEGFGGAFTEAAAFTFARLDPAARAAVLKACFDPGEGLGYTLCRTHINSCDFSLGSYACDEVPGDEALEHFSIDRDRQLLVPMIRAAIQAAGSPFKLFASPWSPPAWMKTNGRMDSGGRLRPECRSAWARYYARFVQAYAGEGVPIWGLSVQNEPEAAQTWESCLYTAEEERDFVRDHLGPTLQAEGLGHLRLIIWDHNRDRMLERASVVFNDPAAAQYVWGTGFHWYAGDHFDNVQALHDAFPEKALVFTEGCLEGGPHRGEWESGERYAHSMINDLNRWTAGWVDWNLLLDEQGGPNHVGNYCSAPILIDTQEPSVQGIHFQSSYYYIGHFSRFIRPGAQRVGCVSSVEGLEAAAFQNTSGRLAVVVMNRTGRRISFPLQAASAASALAEAPARSITTFLIQAA